LATTELSRNPADANPATSALSRPAQRLGQLLLLFAAVAFSAVAFLTLDWVHSARLQTQAAKSAENPDPCRVRDPIRHHAFKPNCASVNHWGTDAYKVFTNSLGFRDQQIRQVSLTDSRRRILILGNSYTEGKVAWNKSYVGQMAADLPQYDFLNGGVDGYSPSNFLNTTRMVLDKGVEVDEVIVFLDNSAVQLEAAFYRDLGSSGAVTAIPPEEQHPAVSSYGRFRKWVAHHFVLSFHLLRTFERAQGTMVRHGFYHLPGDFFGDPFDMEVSAWSYRKVNEAEPFGAGYAPLGVEGGIARDQAKMNQLWEELKARNIPISVVVYPHLAQVVHDTPDSRQVRLWRQWCEGKCKRFISVFPDFFAAKKQCPSTQQGCWYSKLFIFGDIHYAAGGNTLVADAVVKSLAAEPPVKVPQTSAQREIQAGLAHTSLSSAHTDGE
jgi:hypothetical protein